MILLTDEEMETIYEEPNGMGKFCCSVCAEQVAKLSVRAQLKRVMEWRNEECTEHDHTINISGFNHKSIVMHNDCEKCWQSILEEVK